MYRATDCRANYRVMYMNIKNISVGDSTIEVFISGSGEGLVLLPGLGVDVSIYEDLIPRLNKAGYKIICLNYRGIGGSVGSIQNLTLHDYADDVAGVIQYLGIGPIHVVGAAFGNRVARCFAQDYPGLVKSVVLISAGGLIGPDPDVAPIFQKMLTSGLEDMTDQEKREMIGLVLYSPATDISKVRYPGKVWYDAIPSQAYAAQVTKLNDWWAGGNAPMLIIQGLDDRVAPPGNGRDLQSEFGERIKLIEVENAGHALLDEWPEIIADSIVSYLNG